jgi:hypothetical protein
LVGGKDEDICNIRNLHGKGSLSEQLEQKRKKKSKKRTMREIRYEGWVLWFLSTALEKAGCHLERSETSLRQ